MHDSIDVSRFRLCPNQNTWLSYVRMKTYLFPLQMIKGCASRLAGRPANERPDLPA